MTPMGQLSLCAEDDYLNATSGRTTMLAVRRLSAGERALWGHARVRLGELVSRSLVLIPGLYAADPPGGGGRHDRVRWTGGVGRGSRRSVRGRAVLAAPRARVPT